MSAKLVGALVAVVGVIFFAAGATTWFLVQNQLADEHITVSSDSSWLAGNDVKGPFSAFAEAQVIQHHALDATGGKTYAQLDRTDPLRDTAMTASFLRGSLFTSVVAFGVAAFAMVMGVVLFLLGLAVRQIAPAPSQSQSHAAPAA
jgi:hypothetical protein